MMEEGTGTDFDGSESYWSTSATSFVAAPKTSPTKKGKGSKHTQGFCNVCTLLSVKGKLQWLGKRNPLPQAGARSGLATSAMPCRSTIGTLRRHL